MEPIRITMLISGLGLTGTPRVMMDIIEHINHNQYDISVAYKPEYPGSDLDILRDLKDMGITLIPLRGKRLFSFSGITDLYGHLSCDRVQIIHCWDALGIVARILKFAAGCRVIESYCNPVISKGSWKYYFVNKITSLAMDGIIFCTPGVEASYISSQVLNLRRKKTAVIADCINCGEINEVRFNKDQIKDQWGLDKSTVILTNIGLFNEQKGQEYVIRAMKAIVAKIKNVKLILVGWGSHEEQLRMESKRLEVESNILFAGKCQRDVVFEILSITDVFVLSSLWEGFGLVLGEAMASGVPVVATDTDGSREVVINGETGLIVPSKNPEALAQAVLELIDNPDLRRKMGEKGRRRINAMFTPQQFIKRHQQFYNRILAG